MPLIPYLNSHWAKIGRGLAFLGMQSEHFPFLLDGEIAEKETIKVSRNYKSFVNFVKTHKNSWKFIKTHKKFMQKQFINGVTIFTIFTLYLFLF